MNTIKLSDVTMKQVADGFSLSFKEKIELAKLLDKLGVSVIELEGIENARIDSLRIKSIAAAVSGSTVAVPVSLTPDSPAFAMWNDCWLDVYDLIAEGVLMPLSALVMSVLIGWFWKIDTVADECELSGSRFKFRTYYKWCFRVVVPVIMAIVLVAQLMDFFG